MPITSATFKYLDDLKKNNNREWFHENKKRYDHVKSDFEETIQELINSIGEFENLEGVQVKHCNYRIARDVRFTNNKDPYKTHLSASFSEGGRKSGKMDYYLHISAEESFLGGGMYSPTPEQLARLRQEIDYNAQQLKSIIYDPKFAETFGEAEGETVKSAPKGYSKDNPEIELLRKKQMFYWHKFTTEEVQSPDFVKNITEVCRTMKPFLDFLNYVFFDHPAPI